MYRIVIALSAASVAGLFVGLHLGLSKWLRALFAPFFTLVSIVPPLALLPILFIAVGVDELAKIVLIFAGTFPAIARDMSFAAQSIASPEQVTKAATLGASSTQFAYRIVLPQILPRLIDSVRLSLGPAWLFLIAAEAIAAQAGLGYRIFLVRRYLAMDVIIPYVLWITALGFAVDLLLKRSVRWICPWYVAGGES